MKSLRMAVLSIFLSIFCMMPVMAEEKDPSAELSVAFLSQYIWRGQELSQDSMVIQPSTTIDYKGFSVNLWANLDTNTYTGDTNSLNETDLTISYEHKMGVVALEGGYIYYGLNASDDSQEVFLNVTLEALLSPTVTVYREFAHFPSWYIAAGIFHSFVLPYKMSLDLGAQGSYLASDDEEAFPEIDSHGNATNNKFNNFHDGTLSVVLNIPIGKFYTVSLQAYYTLPLSSDASDEMKFRSVDRDDDQFFYGGVTILLE